MQSRSMPMPSPPAPEGVAAALHHAGVEPSIGIELEWRTWRWVGHAGADIVVFVPPSKEAAERLSREADLLELIRKRSQLNLPQVLYRHADTGLQVRRKVLGVQIPSGEEPVFGDTSRGLMLAKELGEAIADLHSGITLQEGLAMGLSSVEPRGFSTEVIAALQAEAASAGKASALHQLLTILREEPPSPSDVVVVHGDIWRGNMAIDPKSGSLIGLFDFDECGLADRHFDLRYAHSFGGDFATRCFAAYSAKSGAAISSRRTAMYHALSAFEALHEAILGGDSEDIGRRRAWVAQVCSGPIGRHLRLGE